MSKTHKYDSILHQPYRKSTDRPQMSMHDRAAQFAPFATVTGHGDEIRETERLTDGRRTLTEEEAAALDAMTQQLIKQLAAGSRPEVTVTYFQPDAKKEGGCYRSLQGRLRHIDTVSGYFIFADEQRILLADIILIEQLPSR